MSKNKKRRVPKPDKEIKPLDNKDGTLIQYGPGDGVTQNPLVAYGEEQDFCDI